MINKKERFIMTTILMVAVAALGTTTTAYGQITIATFDEIDRDDPDYQQLISEVVRILENRTASSVSVFTGDSNFTSITFESESPDIQNVEVMLPNNYTTAQGYQHRDNTVYKPDGTELFAYSKAN